jgi:hypothetical protein
MTKPGDVPNSDFSALEGVTRNSDGTYNIDRPEIVARDLTGADVIAALGLPHTKIQFHPQVFIEEGKGR